MYFLQRESRLQRDAGFLYLRLRLNQLLRHLHLMRGQSGLQRQFQILRLRLFFLQLLRQVHFLQILHAILR